VRNCCIKCGEIKVLMLSILDTLQDFKFSKSFFEFLEIHIWLTPLLEFVVEQYLLSDSLIAVSSLVSGKDRDLVEHLLESAIYLCEDFYAILESNKGRAIQTDPDF
jgi:hypothetical protein